MSGIVMWEARGESKLTWYICSVRPCAAPLLLFVCSSICIGLCSLYIRAKLGSEDAASVCSTTSCCWFDFSKLKSARGCWLINLGSEKSSVFVACTSGGRATNCSLLMIGAWPFVGQHNSPVTTSVLLREPHSSKTALLFADIIKHAVDYYYY